VRFHEDELQRALTHLTGALLGLEILQTRTTLTAQQRRLVEHALRSTRGLRDILGEAISREGASDSPGLSGQIGARTGARDRLDPP
jgi:hypothetical protein